AGVDEAFHPTMLEQVACPLEMVVVGMADENPRDFLDAPRLQEGSDYVLARVGIVLLLPGVDEVDRAGGSLKGNRQSVMPKLEDGHPQVSGRQGGGRRRLLLAGRGQGERRREGQDPGGASPGQ